MAILYEYTFCNKDSVDFDGIRQMFVDKDSQGWELLTVVVDRSMHCFYWRRKAFL